MSQSAPTTSRRGIGALLAATAVAAAALLAPATVGPAPAAHAAPGALRIQIVVDDPHGGYVGGTSKTYAGSYDCGGVAGTYDTARTNAPVTIADVPEGAICTVTPALPAGSLLNASFSWATPTTSPEEVTIGDAETATIVVTHPVAQSFATFSVSKAVDGPGGYTGGTDRVFPIGYTCTLTNGPTTSNTLLPTIGAAAVSPAIPVGSVCTFTETLAAQPGDFADVSYVWSGWSAEPSSLTVAEGARAVVTNAYVRETGELVVAKTVEGAGYLGEGAPFLFDYDCDGTTGRIAVAAGSTGSAAVPARIECTVKEQTPDAGLLAAGYRWGEPVWSTATTATVPASGSVTLAVTNPILGSPVPTPTPPVVPSPTTTPPAAVLSTTGGALPLGAMWLAAGLLVAGVLVAVIARRRRRG